MYRDSCVHLAVVCHFRAALITIAWSDFQLRVADSRPLTSANLLCNIISRRNESDVSDSRSNDERCCNSSDHARNIRRRGGLPLWAAGQEH